VIFEPHTLVSLQESRPSLVLRTSIGMAYHAVNGYRDTTVHNSHPHDTNTAREEIACGTGRGGRCRDAVVS
jgi:hypothetical protein